MSTHSIDIKAKIIIYIATSLALVCAGCGGAINTVRPDRQNLRTGDLSQSGEKLCQSKSDEAEVLVVDFPSSQRGNLEVMMREGVVAVKYNCQTLNVLRACKVDGSYAFKGTLLKEELLRLESADEISANLPFTGSSITSKLGANLERGATLDLAILSIGQQRTARYEVSPSDLQGRCKGASHFIYSAHVGAFAMMQGEQAQANVAAEAMGIGAQANALSKRAFYNKDGSLTACKRTRSTATQPQPGCGAILKLYLIPISKSSSKLAQVNEDRIRVPTCPGGLKYVQGKCTAKVKQVCTARDLRGCKSLCAQKDRVACSLQANAYFSGQGTRKNMSKAVSYYKKSCALNDAYSCAQLGKFNYSGKAGVSQNYKRAYGYYLKGCELGDGKSCFKLAMGLMKGKGIAKDEKTAFLAYNEGCAAGYPAACTNLGKEYSRGNVVKQDFVKSFKLYMRACEGGSKTACYNVGVRYSKGKGVSQNTTLRNKYYTRACRLGHKKACKYLKKYSKYC